MTHVVDDLELYAVGALPDDRMREIDRHLAACSSCRAAVADLEDVVGRLADAIPSREPSAGLRARILAAARVDKPRRSLPFHLPRLRPDPRIVVVAATIAVLVGVAGDRAARVRALEAETARYEAIADNFAHGGRTWYMEGVDQWRGMGGNLMQPASGDPAFVVFHGVKPLSDGQLYALWLISRDGQWVRGANFRPAADDLQMVTVGQELAGFDRCAVTVETSWTGKREGPIVMQSRIAPPAP